VEVLQREPEKEAAEHKGAALDLRVRLATGEQIDIEMQSQHRAGLIERIVFYWARMYSGQLVRGEDHVRLRKAVVILLANFRLFETPRFHSVFSIRDDHDARPLTDQLELHVIELPKVRSRCTTEDELELTLWARFFTAESDEDLEQLAGEHPLMKQAKDALDLLSNDPIARVEAERREMAELAYRLDRSLSKDAARAEGRAIGMAEGIQEGRAEGIERGRAEGIERGRAEGIVSALTTILEARGLALTEAELQRIRGSNDEAQLERWMRLGLTVQSAAELFTP
jgi:predicted transposase/invertase (TIGR01784 family)